MHMSSAKENARKLLEVIEKPLIFVLLALLPAAMHF